MRRHLGLVLICACSAFAIGCQPMPEDDEAGMMTPQSNIDVPLQTATSSDYDKYAESMQIHSPFNPNDIHVDTSNQTPAATHVAGHQRLPSDTN